MTPFCRSDACVAPTSIPENLRVTHMHSEPTSKSTQASPWNWVERNVLGVVRQMRVDYLPPLMVYAAAGISGLTAIVGTFFIKEYLGLSAEFLAMLGFWAGIPWVLKMPLGHLVDLIWRWKVVAGVRRRGAHRGQFADHAGADPLRGHRHAVHERRGVVRAQRPAGARRLRGAGRRGRRHDGGGRSQSRCDRAAPRRARTQADAHDDADAGAHGHRRRRYRRGVGQHRALSRRQRHVGSGASRHLRRHLRPRPPHSVDCLWSAWPWPGC